MVGAGRSGGGGGCFRWPGHEGGGAKGPPPVSWSPAGEPAHCLHPRFVVAEIWADRVKPYVFIWIRYFTQWFYPVYPVELGRCAIEPLNRS